jgi:putative DNA primase/helicase
MNYHTDVDGEIPEYLSEVEDAPESSEGIIPLGHDRGVYHYYSRSARQVVSLTPDKHTKNAMLGLASLPIYWQATKHATAKGIKWDEAIADLMAQCRRVGIYNPDIIRGRGAWMDGESALLHLGDRIICNGNEYGLSFPGSKYIYEAAQSLSIETAIPLGNMDAYWLMKICSLLRWEKPVYGKMLAGWIALAPICGALKWRPSIWIVGGPGSGKSYIRENIIGRVLGSIALPVQSKTTEAGIRQSLGCDARPVLFDEAEREDQASATRMQSVLDLVRQSSSEGGAEIVKGTGTQNGVKRYRIRSMFAFQSINLALQHSADESRVTVLTLLPPAQNDPEAQRRFADLETTVHERLTSEFTAGLLARSVALMPVIRQNAEVFARVIASGSGTRRLGDQVGTLLAGAYSLHSTEVVTPEKAAEFIGREEWKQTLTSDEEEKDEQKLLMALMNYRVRIGTGEFRLSEVLHGAMTFDGQDGFPNQPDANRKLRSIGLALKDNGLLVSTKHPALKEALKGTPWDAKWSTALLRLPGACPYPKTVKFGTGVVTRAVFIPMSVVDPNGE